jgi:hypothetical protein
MTPAGVRLTAIHPTRQNGLVRRVMLLAIGLAVLLCGSSARTGVARPADAAALSGVASGLFADESPRPGDSDRQWRPQHHVSAAVTESAWKSAPVQAALAATRSSRPLDTARTVRSHDPPARSVPHYLRHTPLLI